MIQNCAAKREQGAYTLLGITLEDNATIYEWLGLYHCQLWQDYQGPDRKFYQGLIQVAVCLHHFGNGNTRGAVKLYNSSTNYIRPYGPNHLGLNVEKLIEELTHCCADILNSDEQFPADEVNPDLIPEIHLQEESG